MTQEILSILGLSENPFSVAIDEAHYYQTEATKQIMTELLYGIETRKGIFVLVGEVGVGKSSLLLQLLMIMQKQGIHSSFIFNTILSREEFLQSICQDFGITLPPNVNFATCLDTLHHFFLEQNAAGKICTIIVDEAHNLDLKTIESLRMLSNLEAGGEKLVQIVLAGQPELKTSLEQPRLRQLRSRISIYEELPPLTKREVNEYIAYKLANTGSQLRPSWGALNWLWKVTLGNVRLINQVMERSLYVLVALNSNKLSAGVVRQAIMDIAPCHIEVAERHDRQRTFHFAWSAVGAFALSLVVAFALLPGNPLAKDSWGMKKFEHLVGAVDAAVATAAVPGAEEETFFQSSGSEMEELAVQLKKELNKEKKQPVVEKKKKFILPKGHVWAVQTHVTGGPLEKAQSLSRLRKKGYNVCIKKVAGQKSGQYTVVLGLFDKREDALNLVNHFRSNAKGEVTVAAVKRTDMNQRMECI
ncbi:MAG: AAA family ATPase [Desulfovibrio sp.]